MTQVSLPVRLVVSMGCPSGIGPEVTALALARPLPGADVVVYGDPGALSDAMDSRGIPSVFARVIPASDLSAVDRVPGQPGILAGRAQLAAIDSAVDAVLRGDADAMVTAPVSKLVITRTGVDFRGHTEHLAARSGASGVVMFFVGPHLRTSLVTTHVSIRDVPARVTSEAVSFTVVTTARALARDFGLPTPRLAVAGLNPHAGEGGMLGDDEIAVIGPGVTHARESLGDRAVIDGPMPAEAAYRAARDGRYDAVVAMYHDQATIASKLLDFGDAVNVTLGLSFVRTSVDHGTAYDIAGRGLADGRGLRAALELAVHLGRGRRDAARTGGSAVVP